ncbi:hypothetical protein [Kocuria marina]|uniref:hypothetical protein n=1 Tax=Kocuria marina TaxID=223184 RepID=UPI0034605E35
MAKLDPQNPPDFEKFGRSLWTELTTLKFGERGNSPRVAETAIECALSVSRNYRTKSAENIAFNKWADEVGL